MDFVCCILNKKDDTVTGTICNEVRIPRKEPRDILKVGFFQKVMAKFSNLSSCHSCEPKIVPALLIPVNDNNKIVAIL